LCYDDGIGVAQEYALPVKWYRKATEQGLAASQNRLGEYSERGLGLAKATIEAAEWYSKAAAQGYRGSKDKLATLKSFE